MVPDTVAEIKAYVDGIMDGLRILDPLLQSITEKAMEDPALHCRKQSVTLRKNGQDTYKTLTRTSVVYTKFAENSA